MARGLALTQQREDGLAIRSVANPIRLGDYPVQLRHAPPTLGQHTDEVLAELGLDAARIAALKQGGVV